MHGHAVDVYAVCCQAAFRSVCLCAGVTSASTVCGDRCCQRQQCVRKVTGYLPERVHKDMQVHAAIGPELFVAPVAVNVCHLQSCFHQCDSSALQSPLTRESHLKYRIELGGTVRYVLHGSSQRRAQHSF